MQDSHLTMKNIINNTNSYENWCSTNLGEYAILKQKQIIKLIIAPLPRRDHKMLQIGCGSGTVLDLLCRLRFNITAVDNNLELLTIAKSKIKDRADFNYVNYTALPYDDDYFDYVSITNILEFHKDPYEIIKEAIRVCKKSLIILTLNPWSLGYFCNRIFQYFTLSKNYFVFQLKYHSPWLYYKFVNKLDKILKFSLYSTPITPMYFWNKKYCSLSNNLLVPIPIGLFCALRFDFEPLAMAKISPLLTENFKIHKLSPINMMKNVRKN